MTQPTNSQNVMTAAKITLVALTLLPAAALAQPAAIELNAVDSKQPLRVAFAEATYGCVDESTCDKRSYKLALKAAMEQDPGYGVARSKKIAGIVILSVGGGGAVMMGFIALIAAMAEGLSSFGYVGDYDPEYRPENDNDSKMARNFGIASLCSLGVALAVGLPVLLSGVSDSRAIRRRAQRRLLATSAGWSLASGPGQAGVGMRYNF